MFAVFDGKLSNVLHDHEEVVEVRIYWCTEMQTYLSIRFKMNCSLLVCGAFLNLLITNPLT